MKYIWRISRFFALWLLPLLFGLLVLLSAAVWWAVASNSGTSWLLNSLVREVGGQVQGVRGSLWRGIAIEDLRLELDGARVQVAGLELRPHWAQLLQQHLHLSELSAQRVSLQLEEAEPEPDAPEPDAEFELPQLPFSARIDRLALGELQISAPDMHAGVQIGDFVSGFTLADGLPRLELRSLRLAQESASVSLDGQIALHALRAPWPLAVDLHALLRDADALSSACLHNVFPASLQTKAQDCSFEANLVLDGSLADLRLRLAGLGQGWRLEASAQLLPEAAIPVQAANILLLQAASADAANSAAPLGGAGAAVPGTRAAAWSAGSASGLALDFSARGSCRSADARTEPGADPVLAPDFGAQQLQLCAELANFSLVPWLPAGFAPSALDASLRLNAGLDESGALAKLAMDLALGEASLWNGQPLAASLRVAELTSANGPLYAPGQEGFDPTGLRLGGLDLQLAQGSANQLRLAGRLGAKDSELELSLALAQLAQLWPGAHGALEAQLHANGALQNAPAPPEAARAEALAAQILRHELDLQLEFRPDSSGAQGLGHAPVLAQLRAAGELDSQGWRAQISALQAQHAGMSARFADDLALRLAADGAWQLGVGGVDLALNDAPLLRIDDLRAGGAAASWHSSGRADSLRLSPEKLAAIQEWLGDDAAQSGAGAPVWQGELEAALRWDLGFDGRLEGGVQLAQKSLDVSITKAEPVRLDFSAADFDLQLTPAGAAHSRARAQLQISSPSMGDINLSAELPVRSAPGAMVQLLPADEKQLELKLDSRDLGWLNLFVDDALEIGGGLSAAIKARSRPDGSWQLEGPLEGRDLRVLALDHGVRVVDGTLRAHFEGERLMIDEVVFPAVLRVTPKEWRTATWISEEAGPGFLRLAGSWDLTTMAGSVGVGLQRYPVLQRADRYAMLSGGILVSVSDQGVDIKGGVVADAGWFDLDMLSSIPALDSDVIIVDTNAPEPAAPPAPPADISASLNIDLGPRFYLTGYGVNSGLVGNMDLKLRRGKLTALGQLRTRGGAIDAYGQHLQLRRGTITFQGDVTNPILDIEALRTNTSVQAGVRVAGSARRARMELVSYPDVNEGEKLSWLILGRGPDQGGGADMSMLLAVGSSFLADGEPFYRRFGVDDLGMRSGELGSPGSVLPLDTVVPRIDSGNSPAEERFVYASKSLGADFKLSIEQALAQTGTVARLGYRLARGLQAELTVGTMNGLALVYRWFARD